MTSVAVADTATARSGSDSSGQHSYDLECVDGTPTFTNTGSGDILVQNPAGTTTYLYLNAGNSGEYDWSGDWKVAFPDPPNSANYVVFDSGGPIDCDDEPQLTYSATAEIVCAGPGVKVTNTGSGDLIAYGATIGTRTELPAGASHTLAWGTGGPASDLLDPTGWDVLREDNGAEIDVTGGTFSLAQYNAKCNVTYSVTAEPVCVGGEPWIDFTKTSTGDVYVVVSPASRTLNEAQPEWRAPWPMVGGEWFPEATWNAFRTDVDPFLKSTAADSCWPTCAGHR